MFEIYRKGRYGREGSLSWTAFSRSMQFCLGSQIGGADQRIVHPVGKVGNGNGQSQLHDLLFGKMLP